MIDDPMLNAFTIAGNSILALLQAKDCSTIDCTLTGTGAVMHVVQLN
jgi:hypothetical protein